MRIKFQINMNLQAERKIWYRLWGIAIACAWWIRRVDSALFQRFFGDFPPELVFVLAAVSGWWAWRWVLEPHGFGLRTESFSDVLKIAFPALGCVTVTVLLDVWMPFPKDINVPFPLGLLFYPAIGLLVEVVFHLLPLALLLAGMRSPIRPSHLYPILLLVATLEPFYQILFSASYPLIFLVVMGLNLFGFNMFQLFVFKRHGLIAMFTLRLMYYAVWHGLWAQIRLDLLF